MQTGEETAAAEEPILEEGSGREQVREGRSTRLFGVSSLVFSHENCAWFRLGHSAASKRRAADSCSFSGKTCV